MELGVDIVTKVDTGSPRSVTKALRVRGTKDGVRMEGLNPVVICAGDSITIIHHVDGWDQMGRSVRTTKRFRLDFEEV